MKTPVHRLFEFNPPSLEDILKLSDKIEKMKSETSDNLSKQYQTISEMKSYVDKIARQMTELSSLLFKTYGIVDILSKQFNSISTFENLLSYNISQQKQNQSNNKQELTNSQNNNPSSLGFDPFEMSVPIQGGQQINMTQEQLAALQAQQMAINRKRGKQ